MKLKKRTMNLLLVLFAVALSAPVIAQEGTYKAIPSKSKIKWKGYKIIGAGHSGKIQVKTGEIKVTEKSFTGTILIDMNTIVDTDMVGKDKADLEGHLKSKDFFNVKEYPTALLTIKKADKKKGKNYQISATLKIKGISKPISFPAQITFSKNTLKGKGKLTFDRTDYKVKYGSKKFFLDLAANQVIKDKIDITFSLLSKK